MEYTGVIKSTFNDNICLTFEMCSIIDFSLVFKSIDFLTNLFEYFFEFLVGYLEIFFRQTQESK